MACDRASNICLVVSVRPALTASPAATIVAATTVIATASTAAVTAATTAAATAIGWASLGLARTRFVARDPTAGDLLVVQPIDRCLGFVGIGHFHKRKSTRSPRLAIDDDADFGDFTESSKGFSNFIFRRAERKIAYINIGHKHNPRKHRCLSVAHARCMQTQRDVKRQTKPDERTLSKLDTYATRLNRRTHHDQFRLQCMRRTIGAHKGSPKGRHADATPESRLSSMLLAESTSRTRFSEVRRQARISQAIRTSKRLLATQQRELSMPRKKRGGPSAQSFLGPLAAPR